MIDKVYIINLDRRRDKWLAMQAACIGTQISYKRIKRIPAVDGRRYSSLKQLSTAMQSDGFYSYTYPPPWENWGVKNQLATQWSHLKVLREVASKNNETAIIFEDDVLPLIRFQDLEKAHDALMAKIDGPLDILFLDWWFPNAEEQPDFRNIPGSIYAKRQESKMVRVDVPKFAVGYDTAHEIYANFRGTGDRARLITSHGARRLLELYKSYPWGLGEMLPWLVGLYESGIDTRDGRQQFWDACEKLAPFAFYAVKPQTVAHTPHLFKSDVHT